MKRKYYRDRFDKKIAGVCGGLAQRFQVDSTLIRIIFLALILCTAGLGLLFYLILALCLPRGPIAYVQSHYKKLYKSRTDRMFLGVLGGIGQYFGFNPNILRLIFCIVMVFSGVLPLAIVYFILAVIIPEKIT